MASFEDLDFVMFLGSGVSAEVFKVTRFRYHGSISMATHDALYSGSVKERWPHVCSQKVKRDASQ